jgi:hypothetical protein
MTVAPDVQQPIVDAVHDVRAPQRRALFHSNSPTIFCAETALHKNRVS